MARVAAVFSVLLTVVRIIYSSPVITAPSTVLNGIEQLFDLKDDRVLAISSAMMSSYIDETMDPCNDFFKYACGKWKNYNSHEDRSYSVSQLMQYYINNKMLNTLKESKNFEDSKDIGQKIKIYFDSCIDINAIKNRKVEPIKEYLRSLGGCPSLDFKNCSVEDVDWLALAANIKTHNEDYIIGSYVGPDFLDTTKNVVIFGEPYLTFGSPKGYSDGGSRMGMLRELISFYGQMTGRTKYAGPYFEFETVLASISTNSVEQTHSSEVYERYNISEMHEKFPGIDWRRYLSIIRGKPVNDSEIVGMIAKDYYLNLSQVLSKQPKLNIVNYLMGRFAFYLIKEFTADYMYTDESRWEINCVEKVMKYFDLPTAAISGELFMKKKRRKDAIRMAKEFKADLENIFTQSQWLDPETKEKALKKLKNVKLKAMGLDSKNYNGTLMSEIYSDVTVKKGTHFENSISVLKSFGQREQWQVYSPDLYSPRPPLTTVNAHLDISTNRIYVGAGSLIPPYYHLNYAQFQKYAVLGFFIGHEITHAFDNFGHKFDHTGELRNWWTEATLKELHKRLHCLVEYFNGNEEVDAHFSLNENIADNVGIGLAFRAYQKWLGNNPGSRPAESNPQLGNRTSEQLFFIAFAQSQCTDDTDTIDDAVDTDRHINNKGRVIASLANLPEFSEMFNCPSGSPMNPQKKCIIW